jgi:D-sedoheptulose 7-phosphate isomerase
MVRTCDLASGVEEQLLERNRIFERFFEQEAPRLALVCREMSERFLEGGRLLAFGCGPYATDAQRVSVEFVNPIIVGKRALPAWICLFSFARGSKAILRAEDIVMGSVAGGDPESKRPWPRAGNDACPSGPSGNNGSYTLAPPTRNPFLHQELMEILYHTLWETVHVFFEHREVGGDIGASGFLYPFLGEEKQQTGDIVAEVAASIRAKAREDADLRAQVAREQSEQIVSAARTIHQRLERGGKRSHFRRRIRHRCERLGHRLCPSARGIPTVPAISLSMEPASHRGRQRCRVGSSFSVK